MKQTPMKKLRRITFLGSLVFYHGKAPKTVDVSSV
jgi:hypothetical protein